MMAIAAWGCLVIIAAVVLHDNTRRCGLPNVLEDDELQVPVEEYREEMGQNDGAARCQRLMEQYFCN